MKVRNKWSGLIKTGANATQHNRPTLTLYLNSGGRKLFFSVVEGNAKYVTSLITPLRRFRVSVLPNSTPSSAIQKRILQLTPGLRTRMYEKLLALNECNFDVDLGARLYRDRVYICLDNGLIHNPHCYLISFPIKRLIPSRVIYIPRLSMSEILLLIKSFFVRIVVITFNTIDPFVHTLNTSS